MTEWKPIDPLGVKFAWHDCSCVIWCPCGNGFVLSNELVICPCGREYRLVTRVEMKEHEEHSS